MACRKVVDASGCPVLFGGGSGGGDFGSGLGLWSPESLAGFVRKVWRMGEHASPILLRNCQPHIRGKIVEPTRLPLTGVRTDPLRGPAAHVVGLLRPGWDRSGNHRVPACLWCFHRPERKVPLAPAQGVANASRARL
jgi:hypothetical protein